MPFLLLLVLTLTCLQPRWPAPPFWLEPLGSLGLACGGVLVLLLLARLLARVACHQLAVHPEERSRILYRYGRLRRYHFFALLGFYLASLYLLGWGWTVRHYLRGTAEQAPGQEGVILAPLLLGLLFCWIFFYDVELAAHQAAGRDRGAFLSRWAYVLLQIRNQLLLIVPPLFLLLVQQTVLFFFPALQKEEAFLPLFGMGLLAFAFLSIPLLLRLVLGLKPLPAGPLRSRLLAASRRLRFRCNNLLVWNTGNTVANAMVTGPFPFLRYVVLTDRLIRDLQPEEIEAVFGHEVGHVKHHHMFFYICFLLASLVALGSLWNAAVSFLEQDNVKYYLSQRAPFILAYLESSEIMAIFPLLVLTAIYIFVVFGFLSRRCEKQADIFGCRTVSYPVFIEALEKVAHLNGIPREKPGWLSSWQHSTIALRVAFLQRLSVDPTLEARFQRRVGLMKLGLALGLLSLLWVLGPEKVWDILWQL